MLGHFLQMMKILNRGQLFCLSGLSSRKIRKQWVTLLAYNLIRLLMAQAAQEAGLHPRNLSFKHAVQMWTLWVSLRHARGQDWCRDTLLKLIAQIRVGH